LTRPLTIDTKPLAINLAGGTLWDYLRNRRRGPDRRVLNCKVPFIKMNKIDSVRMLYPY